MEILVIGYSNLFKNRILHLIDELEFIDKISIAKYSAQNWDEAYKSICKPVTLYDDFDSALDNFQGDLAYISTTNHSHFEWAKKTLEKGFHTIVDKPATIELEQTEQLLNIAKSKKLLLSESIVYLYHPQIKVLKDYMYDNKLEPKYITFLFSFPPLNNDNFRNVKELGGGALLDTGPYLASLVRFFFNDLPLECNLIKNEISEANVEISYSVLLKFSEGRSLVGHSGFTTEYINHINILGNNICVDLDRVFTLPENVENVIKIRSKNENADLIVPAGNMFKEYFTYINKSVNSKLYDNLYNDILKDAQIRNLLKIK